MEAQSEQRRSQGLKQSLKEECGNQASESQGCSTGYKGTGAEHGGAEGEPREASCKSSC